MKNAIALLSSNEYAMNTASIFGAIRNIGNWHGDLIVIGHNWEPKNINLFKSKKVIVLEAKDSGAGLFLEGSKITHPRLNVINRKLLMFSSVFKEWDNILNIDADFVIRGDVNSMFDQDGDICFDKEVCPIWYHFFETSSDEKRAILRVVVDPDAESFNFGGMFLRTKILKDDDQTIVDILNAGEPLLCIMERFTDVPCSCIIDQSALNIYYYKKWAQIKGMAFISNESPEIKAAHCTRFHAPWSKATPFYKQFIENQRRFLCS